MYLSGCSRILFYVLYFKTFRNVPEGVFIANSMDSAVEITSQPPLCDCVERLFVIGGSSIYKVGDAWCWY